MPDADRSEKIRNINLLMRVLGVEAVLRSGCVTPVLPYARPTKFGITQPEVDEALRDMKDFDDWPASWEKAALRHEDLARNITALPISNTVRDSFIHASYMYHLAQLYARDPETKRRLHKRAVETYRDATKYFSPPVEVIKILFEELEIPGYLRMPAVDKNVPWVILVNGADTTKEEAHYQAEAFLDRGLAVFYFDGPGQGELRYCSKVQLGLYDRVISEIITVVTQKCPLLSQGKIGIYGISTGGYLSLRAAIFDDRIDAVVSVGGFVDARGFFNSPITTQESMCSLFGKDSIEEMGRFIKDELDIKGSLHKLQKPLLIVYGGRDHLVPKDEIDDLARACDKWVAKAVFKDGTHALQNVDLVVRSLVGDWMASVLAFNAPLDIRLINTLW